MKPNNAYPMDETGLPEDFTGNDPTYSFIDDDEENMNEDDEDENSDVPPLHE